MDKAFPATPLFPLLAAIATAIAAPAFAQTTDTPPRITLERPLEHVRDLRLCVRPFEHRGSVVLRPGYSGSTGSFLSPESAILRIDRVRTTLRAPGLRASALGTTVDGRFTWIPMTIADGSGRFPPVGGPAAAYADRGTLVKIEINRNTSSTGTVTGDYVLNGCLVDRIPVRMEQPHIDPPRLPPNIPLPGETVRQPR
ncbi:hypothetical protein E2F46_02740 [Luteimonas aestuarii]|uniref:Uncharacterized protein n=1 Tax=Luteimonas aestuarii TaxID=453837 RepID=A0A4R5U0N7_9GAMM|nr:hypothetical protein [Luteimonas aestuarii]TDK27148.1 hypothetical protein E2F46_02740 [Luteimonas aestuarii]